MEAEVVAGMFAIAFVLLLVYFIRQQSPPSHHITRAEIKAKMAAAANTPRAREQILEAKIRKSCVADMARRYKARK